MEKPNNNTEKAAPASKWSKFEKWLTVLAFLALTHLIAVIGGAWYGAQLSMKESRQTPQEEAPPSLVERESPEFESDGGLFLVTAIEEEGDTFILKTVPYIGDDQYQWGNQIVDITVTKQPGRPLDFKVGNIALMDQTPEGQPIAIPLSDEASASAKSSIELLRRSTAEEREEITKKMAEDVAQSLAKSFAEAQ
jgi:hypothetical protein